MTEKTIIIDDMRNIYERGDWKTLKNSTVLITGAYGMLASYMVFFLVFLNEEYEYNIKIITMVRNREKMLKRFGEAVSKDYFIIYTDSICDKITITEHVDYIIHAASLASPQYYQKMPVEVLEPNIIGTYYLLKFAEQQNLKGFLLFSTGDIYGKITDEKIKTIKETDCGITDTLDRHSCYGESKRMAETMCMAWAAERKIPCKIARIWHTYGITMDIENDSRVFASFVKDIVNNRDIIMKSSGVSKRSFIYITDAVVGYFKILIEGKSGEAYNVCNTTEFCSIKELAERLVKLSVNGKLKVIAAKRDKNEDYLENNVANSIPPDNRKLMSLGWISKFTIEQGFARVINGLQRVEKSEKN